MRRLVWFRGKDLRLGDHLPLATALADGEALLAFVLDPHFFSPERAARAPRRIAHLLEALAALKTAIETRGGHLILVEGRSVEVIPRLAGATKVEEVLVHRWSEPFARIRDERIEGELARSGIRLRSFEGESLLPPGSVRTGRGQGFRVYSAFARAARRALVPGRPLSAPERLPPLPPELELGMAECPLPSPESLGIPPSPLPAGEAAARLRRDRFLADGLESYASGRDDLAGDGGSRLSADLHFGTLSVRELWADLEGGEGTGPERFRDQLLWRDFAHHLLWERPELLTEPFRPEFKGFPWRQDEGDFRAWRDGETGLPLVDAAARQLKAEGFVHNRARMVAASFLAKHLGLDFRLGEAHYLSQLVDGDWANNDMGWQWSAGCGCDAQPWFRIFNPVAQGERFDPGGAYVRRWIPELRRVPDRWVHEPWKSGLALDYPPPVIDLALGRARFLATAKAHLQGKHSGGVD